jgi:hypothetical protein
MKNSENIKEGKMVTGKVSLEKIGFSTEKTGFDVLQYEPLVGLTESPIQIIESPKDSLGYQIVMTKHSNDRDAINGLETEYQDVRNESYEYKDEFSNDCR